MSTEHMLLVGLFVITLLSVGLSLMSFGYCVVLGRRHDALQAGTDAVAGSVALLADALTEHGKLVEARQIANVASVTQLAGFIRELAETRNNDGLQRILAAIPTNSLPQC